MSASRSTSETDARSAVLNSAAFGLRDLLQNASEAVTTSSSRGRAIVVEECRTPTEVSQRFADAINAGDLEGALECWSPAAVIATPDGSEVRGHAALTERFRGLIDSGARLQISVADEVCTEFGAVATTRMTMTVLANDEPRVVEAAAVVAYVPGTRGLQILIDHIKPPPA
jgi:ketosteroid isomerase-like protein